jgi:hypothetical protein
MSCTVYSYQNTGPNASTCSCYGHTCPCNSNVCTCNSYLGNGGCACNCNNCATNSAANTNSVPWTYSSTGVTEGNEVKSLNVTQLKNIIDAEYSRRRVTPTWNNFSSTGEIKTTTWSEIRNNLVNLNQYDPGITFSNGKEIKSSDIINLRNCVQRYVSACYCDTNKVVNVICSCNTQWTTPGCYCNCNYYTVTCSCNYTTCSCYTYA